MDRSPRLVSTVEESRRSAKDAVPPGYFDQRADARVIGSEAEALAVGHAFAKKIAGEADLRDRERRLPFAELRELSASGLLGITVPRAYTGLGVAAATLVEIFRVIAAADPAIGQIPQNHFVFVRALELEGDERQKHFFFERLLRGDQFGNALSERGTRDVLEIKTRLTAGADGLLRLDGRKFYCTGALFAQWIPVFALNEADRLVVAYVRQGTPGVIILDDWSGVGQRVTASGTVIFEDVAVAAEHVVELWRAYTKPGTLGAFAQLLHVAIDVGIATAALGDAAAFVRERSRSWAESCLTRAADEPHLIKRFGQLHIALQASLALLEKAASAFDAVGGAVTEEEATRISVEVASAKSLASDTVLEIANALFELAGTASMDAKYGLDRHWRNARIHTLHDPARWKQYHVGNWYLNGVAPPRVYS
jgi:SfnB family sulfur acquisition oxidoreductase